MPPRDSLDDEFGDDEANRSDEESNFDDWEDEEEEKRMPHIKKMLDDFNMACLKAIGIVERTDDELVQSYLRDFKERQELEKDDNLEDEDAILYPIEDVFVVKFVDTNKFNLVVAAVIILNAVCIGVETEASLQGVGDEASALWMLLEGVFGLVFLGELICRFYCHRLDLCQRPSMAQSTLLDIIVVSASFVNIIMIYIAQQDGGNARLITMLRLARLLRLVRVLRLFALFKELRMLVVGLISSMKILVWISGVLCVLSYCFAIWLTIFIGHDRDTWKSMYKETANRVTRQGFDILGDFSFLQNSVFSAIRLLTIDDSWESFIRYVVFESPWLIFFFLAIYWIGTLALFNVMVGVVIERVHASAESDATYAAKIAKQKEKEVYKQLKAFFIAGDVNENGMLSVPEIEAALELPELYNKLKMIGFPVDDPGYMFKALDVDIDSQISIDEFFEGCERSSGPLLSKDNIVAKVNMERLHRHYTEFEWEFDQFKMKVDFIASMSTSITEHGEHIFLNMQEYRARHPKYTANTMKISMKKLDNAPWELGPMLHRKYSELQDDDDDDPWRSDVRLPDTLLPPPGPPPLPNSLTNDAIEGFFAGLPGDNLQIKDKT